MAVVLKVKFADEIRRVELPQGAAQGLDYEKVSQAIAQIWPDLPACKAKYFDCEGDLCTLAEQTMSDFVRLRPGISNGQTETIWKLELHPISSKEASPTRKEEASSRKVPNLLWCWVHLFTMGFNADRLDVLEEQGPKELATKIKAEASAMSLVIALCWKDVVSLYLALSRGAWDATFANPNSTEAPEAPEKTIGYYLFAVLTLLAVCGLTTALFCNILLLISMNNLVDTKLEAFLKDAGWTMKVPYLGTVYGLVLYLAAMALLALYADSTGWFVSVIALLGIGCVIVQGSCAKYIHATYVANASGVPDQPAKSAGVASDKPPECKTSSQVMSTAQIENAASGDDEDVAGGGGDDAGGD
jgi:hypothetical protein